MKKFVGTWKFRSQSAHSRDSDQDTPQLKIEFTQPPIEVLSGEVTEYRTGYAFPEPLENTLIDPQKNHGVYEWIHFSHGTKSVCCGADYLGLGRIYYTVTDEQLFFSNDLFILCEKIKKGDLNLLGCAMLLGLGECIGRHTLVDGIYRLAHGEILEFDNLTYHIKAAWRLMPPDYMSSPKEFIDVSNDLLLTSIASTKEYSQGRTCLLSGGDDSRRIAAALDVVGLDVNFITQRYIGPGGWDEDTIPAQMITKILNKPLTLVDVSNAAELRKDIYTTLIQTNAESTSHSWLQKTLKNISSSSLVYDGLAGGDLMNGHYVKSYSECAENFHNAELLTTTLLKKCPLKFRSSIRNSLESAILEEFDNISETPYRMTLFHLYNHTRRGTGSVAAMMREHGLVPYMPFTTKDTAIHALSLDYREHFNNYYQGLATRSLNQELAQVPRTRLGVTNDCKINLNHLNYSATKAALRVGKTNLGLVHRLLSTRDSLYATISEIMGLHSKNAWRSIPLRKLGLVADVISALGSHSNKEETPLNVVREQ